MSPSLAVQAAAGDTTGWPAAVIARIEAIAANPASARAGRRLLDEGSYEFRGFPPARLDLLADWTANPFGHRSWQWHTASFNFMTWLIAQDAQTGDPRAMAQALATVRSWRERFVDRDSDYEFAWHDHATSSRALNVLWLLGHLRRSGREPQAQHELESFLARHAGRLAEEGMYSRHTNHGIDQSRVLGMLGVCLPDQPGAADWLATAMTRLADELTFAFGPDGTHVENSPTYHQFVSNLFGEIARTFTPAQLGPMKPALDAILPKALDFMTWIVRPDGHLPPLGDSEQRPAINVYGSLAGTPDYARLEWVLSGSRQGAAPSGWVRAFESGGYLVARSDWSIGDPRRDAFHLVFRSGFRSVYHRHDDDLSLCLYWGGDWLVDSGMYNYVEDAPVRRYLRSKWAHNVPVPEGFGPAWSRPASDADGGLSLLSADGGQARAEAWSASYPGLKARRRLHLDPAARRFEVEDTLQPVQNDGNEQRFHSLWHVPADKQVVIGEGEVRLLDPASGRELRIRVRGDACERITLLDPGLPGQDGAVVSPEINRLHPAQLLSFVYRGARLRSRLEFQMIDPHPELRAGAFDHGRRLFASYCRAPESWWPEAAGRQLRRVTARRDLQLRRLDIDAGQLAEELHALATLRQRSRRPTVYLANPGEVDAAWLESLLAAAGGMSGCGDVALPTSVVQRALDLEPRQLAIFVDALHLLHAHGPSGQPLLANLINSAPTVRPDIFLAPEPGAVSVLIEGDPVALCLRRSLANEADPSRPSPETLALLEANLRKMENFLRGCAKRSFVHRFGHAQLRADPASVVRAVCAAAGASVNEARLADAISRIAPKDAVAERGEFERMAPALLAQASARLDPLRAAAAAP
jgi:hypothetical protein